MVIGIIFTISVSIGLPMLLLIYACQQKRLIAFILGIAAFVVSQVLLRIPILQYLSESTISYSMFSATRPVLFSILLGLSAGVFEELARYIFMFFFMKRRDWQAGFLFGAGHGGIEAILFVGIGMVILLYSPTGIVGDANYLIGGIERFFAMLLHIGLSIIVLQGVVRKKFIYIVIAILIHGLIDALIGILPLYVPKDYALVMLEGTLAFLALAVFSYCVWIKRKGRLT